MNNLIQGTFAEYENKQKTQMKKHKEMLCFVISILKEVDPQRADEHNSK